MQFALGQEVWFEDLAMPCGYWHGHVITHDNALVCIATGTHGGSILFQPISKVLTTKPYAFIQYEEQRAKEEAERRAKGIERIY